MHVIPDFNLKHHNTFGINAKCRLFVEFDNVDDIPQVLDIIHRDGGEFFILGGGSNLLLTSDFNGIVIHPSIKGYDTEPIDGGMLLRAGCGVEWDELVEYSVSNGWYGLENLSLIPGTVGASAVQNVGAYGVEAKDVISSVEAVEIETGKRFVFDNSDCDYSYRYSRFKADWRNCFIITHVTYRLSSVYVAKLEYGNIKNELEKRGVADSPTALQLREVVMAIRREKLPDPQVEGNAGSFFMNPVVGIDKYEELKSQYPSMPHYTIDDKHEKIPAGWLIEQCGWKGRTLGRAGVHDRQALVLVNKGGATGCEILELCNAVRRDVSERFGITIVPEANII